MAATLVNNNEQINTQLRQPILLDAKLFSVLGLQDETDIDETIINENREKQPEISVPIRPWTSLSVTSSSINNKNKNKKVKTRSYKFIKLERALTTANLLKTNDDRTKFENEYLHSINENTFDEFLEKYYQKIHDHCEQIKREQELKEARIFTFIDLEKNFLALDPTRDVKIIFLDEQSSTKTKSKKSNNRSVSSAHQRSISAVTASDTAVESFYEKRSHILLNNPSRAREEITLFARRTAERIHERLPRLTSVPHRVKIIDERETNTKPDERILSQLKHKHALSLINKRRQVIMKMIAQTKKNQIKMEQQWTQPSFAIDSSVCCRELLEQANQIEQICHEEKIRKRPQTSMISRKILKKNMSSISATALSDITTTTTNTNLVSSSNSKPFQDALSVDHIKNVRVILPTRPLTAPMKVNWVNYC